MIAKGADPPATRADLDALPENVVGELVEGVLYASPRPAAPHALAASTMAMDLAPLHRRRGEGGPGGWWILFEPELTLGNDIVVPDLVGWRRERMPIVPADASLTLAPDWICEVHSPSTKRLDRVKKMPVYARAGVGHLWYVEPIAQSLEVFERADDKWLLLVVYGADEKVRAPPFAEVEIDLARWWDRGA